MKKNILNLLKSIIVGMLITIAMLLLVALIMQKFGLDRAQIRLYVILIYGISNIIGGMIFGKLRKHKRVLNGFYYGFTYFVLLLIISLIINHGFENNLGANIISGLVCIIGGIIGGIIS